MAVPIHEIGSAKVRVKVIQIVGNEQVLPRDSFIRVAWHSKYRTTWPKAQIESDLGKARVIPECMGNFIKIRAFEQGAVILDPEEDVGAGYCKSALDAQKVPVAPVADKDVIEVVAAGKLDGFLIGAIQGQYLLSE